MSTADKIDPYEAYRADPSPGNLSAVVEGLKPNIDFALQSVQSYDDPFMRGKARTIAGKAVQSFDPSRGAGLNTWVAQQLQQLNRLRRQSQGPIKMPDRVMLDNMAIAKAEAAFLDEHGRDPDMNELSDRVKLSKKRILDVRRSVKKIPSSAALGDTELASSLQGETDPLLDEAMSYVYDASDLIGRRIMEMKMGMNGLDPVAPNIVAAKLGLTASQLSRRSRTLAETINKTHDELREAYSS